MKQPPTYEGRPLAKPDEEIFDQGLGFDLGTMLGRRNVLRAFGLGVVGLGLAACESSSGSGTTTTTTSTSAAGTSSSEIPNETAGPYPGDGSNGPNVLQQSGIIRGDIRSSFGGATGKADGVPMTIELTIQDLAKGSGVPFAGAAVYVWHCDRGGNYSLYSSGITNENYLRGVQIADSSGKVRFTSIFPACYSGRWPHIHFEVYPDQASITSSSNAIATSQVAIPADICKTVYATSAYQSSVSTFAQVSLSSDNVFGDDSAAKQLGTVSGDVNSGINISLAVPVDTTTTPASGGQAPGGAPSGGPGGQPPSGPPPSN
jgi:protocatechuate 3,4-dioxygenase beta subunit